MSKSPAAGKKIYTIGVGKAIMHLQHIIRTDSAHLYEAARLI